MTEQYEGLLGGSDEAIRRMALHWDMYVSDSLLNSSRKIDASRSRIMAYIKNCNLNQNAGKTYDTYLKELKESESNAVKSLDDLENINESSDANISKQTVKVWGFGYSVEDYDFLNSKFSTWKSRVIIDGIARENLVRDLCVLELLKNKAIQSENIDQFDKLTKTYQKTLESANLKPIQEDANDKNGEVPMGIMIQRFENEKPIPKPDPEWEDVDGIVKFITIYFLGHLCKMLNIKNKYSKIYEDEMAKYRVEVPELSEADDDDIFEYIANGNGESNENKESE